jgi:acetolactate synthase I/II/III large subunit
MPTGARVLVDCLLRERIDHVFGIPGTQNLPILDALYDTPQIRFILTRHEQGAAFMAFGFARASGGPSVVTTTEGPGVTNASTAMAAAYRAFVPVIAVTGTAQHWIRERDANQELDQITFVRPITKWAYSIPSASKVQEGMRKAFRVALSEPLGPVHVESDRDIYLAETEAEPIEPASYRTMTLPDCNPGQMDQVLALLMRARRPVLLAGGGVLREKASEALGRLAEISGIPVAAMQYTPDVISNSHPQFIGPIGRNGWKCANQIIGEADLIIAVGTRMDIFSTAFQYGIISREAKLVHHNTTATQLGVPFPFEVGVAGSTGSFIAGLTERVDRAGRQWSWADIARARADWETERHTYARDDIEPIAPQFVGHAVREALPANGMMVVDAGNQAKHMRVQFDAYEPGTYITMDDFGAVGGAFPIGLGAKLARPDRPVMCSMGDMGMMVNLGELETAVRENIPVVCVVFNDQGLGNERAFQRHLYGGRLYGVDYRNPDFGALAREFGAYGEQVRQPRELQGALRRALESGKPAVVDVIIHQDMLINPSVMIEK